jgi:WD40 repeat protein
MPRTLSGPTADINDVVYDVKFSPDGTILAAARGDATVRLWRVDGIR